ncbi:hypothetical protein A1356_01770 [Methylomonas koyamae]|uniref:Uncharacterized protein n=1 Tax=Methylomonas koyamae TaxID=702114 RepID=A0AA91I4R9_9GAMM|nr:hypothetical protein A1356_01770 [Methylomonas koyamae]
MAGGRDSQRAQLAERKAMIDRQSKLSMVSKLSYWASSAGSVYCRPKPASERDLDIMHRLDELYLKHPLTCAPLVWALASYGIN